MNDRALVDEWLRRAHSNLERARFEYELVLMMAERAVYWMEERITSMRDAEKHE